MSAAAVIMVRIRQNIEKFRTAGATDPAHAMRLEEVGCRDTWVFRRMMEHGVFIQTRDGRYWMDEDAALRYREGLRRRGLITAAITLIVLLFMMMMKKR